MNFLGRMAQGCSHEFDLATGGDALHGLSRRACESDRLPVAGVRVSPNRVLALVVQGDVVLAAMLEDHTVRNSIR